MRDEGRQYDGRESGVALIFAILALLLLTFLGLTLAATTSTELQIATNYRWAEQAYYNAEAGLEVAKAYLKALNPATILPDPRPTWNQGGGAPLPLPIPFPQLPVPRSARLDAWGNPPRNFEPSAVPANPAQNCDHFGDGAGYGVVFDDGATPGLPLQNITQVTLPVLLPGGAVGSIVVGDLDVPADGRLETMRGAFTVWVRRGLTYGDAGPGSIQDDTNSNLLILTAEGVAPAEGAQFGGAGNRFYANRAARVLEATVQVGPPVGNTCNDVLAQTSETGFRCGVNLP